MNEKKYIFTLFLFFASITIFASDYVSIPSFEANSLFFGKSDKKQPLEADLQSSLDIRFTPAPWGYVDFSLNAGIDDIISFVYNDYNNKTKEENKGKFDLFGLSLNFPSILGSSFSMGFFRGVYDELGTDSVLQEHLKTQIPEPEFRNFYPAVIFNPKNYVKGLGLALYGATKSGFYMGGYASWNEKLDTTMEIGADLRMGGNFEPFSFDFFVGAFVPPKNAQASRVRAGTTMLFTVNRNLQFLFEMGLRPIQATQMIQLKPKDALSKVYATFETRVKQKKFDMSITCFMSPVFELPKNLPSTLSGITFAGANVVMGFGNLDVYSNRGGFSVLGTLDINNLKQKTLVSITVTPFYSFRLDKFEFDLRLPINPLKYNDLPNMLAGQIKVKAAY